MSKTEIKEYPQSQIDLMFWQYVQGAKDAINQDPQFMKINEARLEKLIADKIKHIEKLHNGRRPTFDLKAEIINGKFEIKKIIL